MKALPLLRTLLLACALASIFPPTSGAQTATQLYEDAVEAYRAGDVASAKQKLALTLEIDKNFRPASTLLNQINLLEKQAASGQAAGAPVPVRTLETLSFPVEFKDTSLTTALEYIRQQVETVSGGKVQVNFVVQLPPPLALKKVTLRLNHVPVMEVLHYLGDLAGVSFQVQKYAIAVVPAAGAAPAASPTP